MDNIYSPFLADFAGAVVTLLAGVVADDTLRVSHSLDRPVLRVLEDVSENLSEFRYGRGSQLRAKKETCTRTPTTTTVRRLKEAPLLQLSRRN